MEAVWLFDENPSLARILCIDIWISANVMHIDPDPSHGNSIIRNYYSCSWNYYSSIWKDYGMYTD